MLTRISSALFLVWYAAITTGFQVHLHYCCGHLAGIEVHSMASAEEDTCCDSHQTACCSKKGCCSSEDVVLAFDEDKQFFGASAALSKIQYVSSTDFYEIEIDVQRTAHQTVHVLPHGPPLYLLYEQRLHYG
ncbi:MAG: hypothetical protein MK081_12700 [Flavobacteriales bacterium]|nr:hypothetical protein [Flavobacteriales bacterium]